MKQRDKERSAGIRLKVTLYISLFAVILLAVIWVCLVFLLDTFYETEKVNELMKTADAIEENIDSDDLSKVIYEIAEDGGVDVLVINDAVGIMSVERAVSFSSVLNSQSTVNSMIADAEANEGSSIKRTTKKGDKGGTESGGTSGGGSPGGAGGSSAGGGGGAGGEKKPPELEKDSQSMVYCRVVNNDSGRLCILASVVLTPVDATENTIMKLLVIISVIFILLAVAFGFLLSHNIAQPIVGISKKAKSLGDGDYTVRFDGDGYKEIRELSDTLNTAAKDLSRVDELRRELIANVSHDLRTPLTMITGYSEVMRDIPGENTPENIQVVIDEAQYLSRLVNDILSISKIQSGMERVDFSVFNITETAEKIVSRHSRMLSADGYTVTFEYDEPTYVRADETKISQVIYNLLGNAVNYTGDDKTVHIVQRAVYENGERYVRFDVYDSGAGISEENIKHIWDRYYKESKNHKRSQIGTGLGLSIVKGVVSLHGGRCGVNSTEGQGSDFWFMIKATENE